MDDKKDFFRLLANLVIKHRVLVLIFWVVLTMIVGIGAFNVHDVLKGEGSYVKTSESYLQNEIIGKYFPQQYTKNIVITLKSKNLNIDDKVFLDTLKKVKQIALSSKVVGNSIDYTLEPSFLSHDRKSTFLVFGLIDSSADQSSPEAMKVAQSIRELKIGKEMEMHITGTAVMVNDITKISESDSSRAEQKIFPIVIVLMIFIFGALVSAVLPVLIGLMAIIITLGCLYVIGHYFELTMFCKAITSMMGLGVGLDYCLFMVSRFKEELAMDLSPKEAAIEATVTSGKAVCYSGFSVTVGMAVLLIPDLPLTRSIGFSGMLVVSISILLSITLIPVIFSYIGPRINSPRAFHRLVKLTASPKNFWLNWTNWIMKRPVTFLILGTSLLILISLFSLNMKLWNSSILLMPKELDSREGVVQMLEIDPSRKYSPIGITIETKDGSSVYEKKNLEEIYAFMKKMANVEGINRTLGIINPNATTTINEYQALYANTLTLQSLNMMQQNPFVSEDGKRTLFWALHADAEKDTADWDSVIEMRKVRDVFASKNLEILIGGSGSSNVDFQNAVYSQFPLIIFLIVVLTYFIMFSMLGSVLLPIKAILMNLLSVGASYGWLVLVFQYGLFTDVLGVNKIPGALMIITPLVLFCIIFGLSMDYEIFMMSRIKEEYDKSQDVTYSIAMGLERSGGIITSAALIMIIVFSAFSFSKVIMVQEMGVGLATSVLIDATIIRIMLVPSILKLMGKASWWLPEIIKDKVKFVNLNH